jgi:hypothetical protein
VDVNDKKMDQWNVTPPPLYLWSRTDWTARHKAIAEEHAHFSNLAQDVPPSPLHSPLPSEQQQKEAEDIISQVVGEISVKNNEVMEMRQEDNTTRKGKEKLDPGSYALESQAKSGPTVLKLEEEKDVGASTVAIEEVKKINDRNKGREKKGFLERTGSHREARGVDSQNDGRGVREDHNSGASSPLKEARANKAHHEVTVREPCKDYTDKRHRNEGEATRDYQEARAPGPHSNFRETELSRTEKLPDVREGRSYNNAKLPDTRDSKRRSPEMRTSVANHNSRTSGVMDSRFDSRPPTNGDVIDMDICSPNNGRQHVPAIRSDNTATWESNNNPSRYDNTSNRGTSTYRRENNSSRFENTSNRGNSTLQRESNSSRYESTSNRGNSTLQRESNSSRYDCTSNRGNCNLQRESNSSRYDSTSNRGDSTQREKNNTASGDVLPLGGHQYNNAPLMEQPMETRQLDSQVDFSDLGPILSSGNDDFSDLARLYTTSSSYNWTDTSGAGSGSGSILDYSRAPVPDYMDPRGCAPVTDYIDPRGIDDFDGLGRLYGSHDENRHNNFGARAIGQPSSTFHNSTSLPSYGLSGLGGSTSTSALDRYAPRLDETNFLQPGGSLGFSGVSNQFHQGFSGPSPYSYDMHGLDRRDIHAPHPDLSGFGPKQYHSFRPPPGSSGGWIDD